LPQQALRKKLRWIFLAAVSGVLAGLAASAFLYLLDWATLTRESNPMIVWFLPLAGLFIGLAYHYAGRDVAPGTNLILDEIHNPQKVVPARMAPFILLGTVITHLFGGSAGREGTAVQMGASLSDQLSRWFKVDGEERKILLLCGAGAGFAAAIGTPLAGVVFGMEVIQVGKLRFWAWQESLVASFSGFFTAVLLQAPHSVFPTFTVPGFSFTLLLWVALAGVLFGLTALVFIRLTHWIEALQARWIPISYMRPLIGGLLLVGLFYWEGTYRYSGLGISVIQEALASPAEFKDSLLKMIFTAITIGSGFKGGEFIPLVFVGTTLGSALAMLIPVSTQLLAAVGFAAVFAGAANTPIACAIMAAELFGWAIFPYALAACWVSFYCSGQHSIYRSQRYYRKELLCIPGMKSISAKMRRRS